MERGIEGTSIAFIDAGNLVTNLAKVLYRKGFRIVQVYNRTEEPARKLVQKVEAEYTTSLEGVNSYTKLYIISLKDSAFAELLSAIAADKRKEALIVHATGSIPMNVWEEHTSHYGVFYPMWTSSKQREVDFKEIPFFIEASLTEGTALLEATASTLSNRIRDTNSGQRKSLHLAAVFACNFANYVCALVAELSRKHDLPFDVMLSLTNETARKVHELEPRAAQTGPTIHYDGNVIDNHLRMLAGDPGTRQLYELLSRNIRERH